MTSKPECAYCFTPAINEVYLKLAVHPQADPSKVGLSIEKCRPATPACMKHIGMLFGGDASGLYRDVTEKLEEMLKRASEKGA